MKKITNEISLLFGYGYNCNGYLITSNGESILIDSGLGSFDSTWGYSINNPFEELVNSIRNSNVKKIALTHAHLDHVGGVASLNADQYKNLAIYCHNDEKKYLQLPDQQ